MNTIHKYLETWAEPEVPKGLYRSTFFPKKENRYYYCAVIPLYGEASLWLEQGLSSLLKAAEAVQSKTLLIAVLNRHELSESWVRAENESTLQFLNQFPKTPIPDFPLMTLYELNSQVDLILLNHNEEPHLFHSKEGVGKARKLGCDLALALTTTPILNCKYIHTTDGDAIVDPDYFEIEASTQADILLHPYTHVGDYEQMEALRIYEESLRYYVAGLKYANSPYAHESLGSTIATTPECYAKVRGFPKRNAAEDFYFLNKAVKVGKLHQSDKGLVKLLGRKSDRVPFGTGVGTEKIFQKMQENKPITFYHPKCFEVLKNLNAVIADWSESPEKKVDRKSLTLSIVGEVEIGDKDSLEEILETLGFFEILETAKAQRTSSEAILKHAHESWDGFKTLKLVHAIRERLLPSVGLR